MRAAAIERWRRDGERERVSMSNRRTCGDPLYRSIKRRMAEEQGRGVHGYFAAKQPTHKVVTPNIYRPAQPW